MIFDASKNDQFLLNVLSRYYEQFPLSLKDRLYALAYCREKLFVEKQESSPLTSSFFMEYPAFCFLTIYRAGKVISCLSATDKTTLGALDGVIALTLSQQKLVHTDKIGLSFLFDPHLLTLDEIHLGLDSILLIKDSAQAVFKNTVALHQRYDQKTLVDALYDKLAKTNLIDSEKNSTDKLYGYRTLEFIETNDFELCDHYRGAPLFLHQEINVTSIKAALRSAWDYSERALFSMEDIGYRYLFNQRKFSSEESVSSLIRIFATIDQMCVVAKQEGYQYSLEKIKQKILFFFKKHFIEENGYGALYVSKKTSIALNIFALRVSLLVEEIFISHEKTLLLKTLLSGIDDAGFLMGISEQEACLYPAQIILALLDYDNCEGNKKHLLLCELVFSNYETQLENSDYKTIMIAWYAKAAEQLFLHTGNNKYAHFVFELCEPFLSMQLMPGYEAIDSVGAFESTNAVCVTAGILEGITSAFILAKTLHRFDLTPLYQKALFLGLRALLQQQYTKDNIFDAVVVGGFKNSVYDFDIRIDNNQHAMSVLSTLIKSAFPF